MIDNQIGAHRRLGYDCFIRNNQQILLDLADFALHEQPNSTLMVAISGMVQWLIYHGRLANQIPGIALNNDPDFNNLRYTYAPVGDTGLSYNAP